MKDCNSYVNFTQGFSSQSHPCTHSHVRRENESNMHEISAPRAS